MRKTKIICTLGPSVDDEDTLRCKLEVARSLSIHTFLAPWAEVADCAAGLGIRRASPVAGRATSSAR